MVSRLVREDIQVSPCALWELGGGVGRCVGVEPEKVIPIVETIYN